MYVREADITHSSAGAGVPKGVTGVEKAWAFVSITIDRFSIAFGINIRVSSIRLIKKYFKCFHFAIQYYWSSKKNEKYIPKAADIFAHPVKAGMGKSVRLFQLATSRSVPSTSPQRTDVNIFGVFSFFYWNGFERTTHSRAPAYEIVHEPKSWT